MRNQTTFSVPHERGEQLRALARHHRTNTSDMLGEWIDAALADAGLSDTIPGVDISIAPEALFFRAPGFEIGFQARQDAIDVADAMERIAFQGRAWMLMLDSGGTIEIARKGTGVVVTVTDARGECSQSFAPNVIRTIARQLRSVAESYA